MKEIKEQIEIAQLLVKRVLGTLDDRQSQILADWEQKDDNKTLTDSIIQQQNFENWNNQRNAIDASGEWMKFVEQMNNQQPKGKQIHMMVLKAVASVAAVLIIGFSVYYGYHISVDVNNYQTVAEANIQPGSTKAELVLSDGKVVNLERADQKVILEGDLSIENEEGTVDYSDASEGAAVKSVVNTLRVPRGGEYKVVLADGTQVWLNSDSEISFSVPFSNNERRVKLRGEAYFDVAHNANKPFIVESAGQSVEVLGTEFNISVYPEDLYVVTTLVEGKVKVDYLADMDNSLVEYLIPNQQTIINKESKMLAKQNVDPYLFTSWKDGRFKFRNEPLESFLAKVARWYDVEVFITDESIKDIRFTGDLPRYKDMTSILDVIEAEMSVHIEIENNKIIYVSR